MTSKRKYLLRTTALLLAIGAIGAAIALFTARWLVLSAARSRLASYAVELLQQDEQLATNVTDTLNGANASTHPACSEADFAQLRMLLFRSPYIKDIGRLRSNGVLLCSAVGGIFPEPIPSGPPDITTDGGRRVFFAHDLVVTKGYKAQVIAFDRASVVISPDVFKSFGRPPMYYSGYIRSFKSQKRLNTYNNFPGGTIPEEMPLDTHITRNGTLYYSICSQVRPDCLVVGIAVADVLRPNNRDLIGAAAVGAIVSAAFCIPILVMGRRRRSMAWRLRRAIRRDELKVFYQPIVDLSSNFVIGAEALVRWSDDGGASVPPDIFIALAEERGFIREITQLVLTHVLDDLQHMLKVQPNFRVSINLSVQDLLNPAFIPMVDSLLAKSNIPAPCIGFELTERATASQKEATLAIRELRRRGHMVYIDDFGTGYSSLAYLNDLAVDVVKVDRAFTRTIGTGSLMESIVPQILAMAEGLRLKVVVEGIEEEEQVDYLISAAEELLGQGWLFGKPGPLPDLIARLATQASLDNHAKLSYSGSRPAI